MGKTLRKCKLDEYNEDVAMYECVRAYHCAECGDDYAEVVKKGKPKKRKCPDCKKVMEPQILGIGEAFIQEARTLGQLAEQNSKKMGKYEKEDKEKAYYDSQMKGRVEMMKEQGLLDRSTTVDEVRKEKEKLKKINKMTPQQKKDYVLYGKE